MMSFVPSVSKNVSGFFCVSQSTMLPRNPNSDTSITAISAVSTAMTRIGPHAPLV